MNTSGVIPPIFASSLLMFPGMFASYLGAGDAERCASGDGAWYLDL